MSDWVNVNDRLPRDSRRMWVYESPYIYVARFESGNFYDIESRHSDLGQPAKRREIKNVSHWMAVPSAPNDGDQK
ncbi:MAG TPA: DUF551 domain-containing protein [Negativicutes bacterium]